MKCLLKNKNHNSVPLNNTVNVIAFTLLNTGNNIQNFLYIVSKKIKRFKIKLIERRTERKRQNSMNYTGTATC